MTLTRCRGIYPLLLRIKSYSESSNIFVPKSGIKVISYSFSVLIILPQLSVKMRAHFRHKFIGKISVSLLFDKSYRIFGFKTEWSMVFPALISYAAGVQTFTFYEIISVSIPVIFHPSRGRFKIGPYFFNKIPIIGSGGIFVGKYYKQRSRINGAVIREFPEWYLGNLPFKLSVLMQYFSRLLFAFPVVSFTLQTRKNFEGVPSYFGSIANASIKKH